MAQHEFGGVNLEVGRHIFEYSEHNLNGKYTFYQAMNVNRRPFQVYNMWQEVHDWFGTPTIYNYIEYEVFPINKNSDVMRQKAKDWNTVPPKR